MPLSNLRYLLFFCLAILLLQTSATLSSFVLWGEQGKGHWGFAIDPRTLSGLVGVFAAPFVHGSMSHAIHNVIALAMLGTVLAFTAPRTMWRMTLFVTVVGGLCVWLLGRDSLHAGASGVVFGWMGFLVLRGIFERKAIPVLVSLGAAVYFWSDIVGIFDVEESVSWEAHLFSLLAGFAAAYVFRPPSVPARSSPTQDSPGT
jgi:membrane associated rhomboid family serine protease